MQQGGLSSVAYGKVENACHELMSILRVLTLSCSQLGE